MIPNQESLNRFIVEVDELCESHEMVQQSLFGDILRIYSQQQQKYYSIIWDFTTGSIDERFVNLTAQFVISGWVYSDYSNIENIKSDCQKIASDIFSGIQYSRRWQMIGKVNGAFNLEPFIEKTGDKVAGWVVTMNFRLKRKHGICDAPFGNYDFDKDPTNGGNPVLIFENDILVATLYGGDTYYYNSVSCNPATVQLNGTEVGTIESGETGNFPVLQDGLPTGVWNGTEFVIPSCPPPVVKSGVIYKTVPPITNESYADYDEGWRFSDGWWNDLIPTDPLYIAELDYTTNNYFYKLKDAIPVNGVSNTTRFVDVDGVQNFDPTDNKNQIMIDKFTGLGMSRVNIPIGLNWVQKLNYANAYSIEVDGIVYNEWFLMTLYEILEVVGGFKGQNESVIDPITSNEIISLVDIAGRLVDTSTTRLNSELNRWEYQPINCIMTTNLKTTANRIGYMVTKQVRNLIGI